MNINKAFYSDLDLTLIYSHNNMRKYHNTSYASLVVEEHENKSLSYIKLEAWEKLLEGVTNNYLFIPTTTRTFEQYSRVKFPKININYSIILNGGKIYNGEVEDEEWSNHIKKTINAYSLTPDILMEEYEKTFYEIPGVNKVRKAEGHFIYIVKDEAENHQLEEFLEVFEKDYSYKVSHQGRKSYIVPDCLEKGYAIKYLNDKLNITNSVSAGDSILDLSMATNTNYFIQPKHGEGVGKLKDVIVTQNIGSDSAIEILDLVNERLS